MAAGLGIVAAAGNLLGGLFVVRREWPRGFLHYFMALGAGYMLAVAFTDVIPESVRIGGQNAFLFVLIGYFLVHLFEHILAPHFHFGEETLPAQAAGGIHDCVGGAGERAEPGKSRGGRGSVGSGHIVGSAAD